MYQISRLSLELTKYLARISATLGRLILKRESLSAPGTDSSIRFKNGLWRSPYHGVVGGMSSIQIHEIGCEYKNDTTQLLRQILH